VRGGVARRAARLASLHFDPAEFYEWEFWTHPVGNGPYRFVRYVPETMMEFEANAP
jgi:ABC-type transport system substrate-binding protein